MQFVSSRKSWKADGQELFFRNVEKILFISWACISSVLKFCTLFLNGLGFNEKLAALTTPAGNSVGLLLAYLTFGMLFPLAFMWAFRKVKDTIIQRNR